MLAVKYMTTTAFHPQTDWQIKQNNRLIVTQLRHYYAEKQKTLGHIRVAFKCQYNERVRESTNTTPFRLGLSRDPLGPATVSQPSALTSSSYVDNDPGLLMLNFQR